MAVHGGTKIIREGLGFHIDASDDRSYEGAPATNLLPSSKQYYSINDKDAFKYSGTGYGIWSHYTTWDSLGVQDNGYVTISGEIKVSKARSLEGGQGRMYIWTASPTDGWIRSSSWGTSSTKWVPFKVTLQRRNSADTTTSSNTGNGDPIYCRFGFYHYPNSKNAGTTYLRNVVINASSEAIPFTHSSRTSAVFKDFFKRVNMTINSFTPSNDSFFGKLYAIAHAKKLPAFNNSSYVPIRSWPSELNVDDNTTPRTWEVVLKTSSTATQGVYGHKVGAGCSLYCNGGIMINSGNIQFNWYDNSAYRYLNSGVVPNSNNFYHVIATFESDAKPRIYVNGKLMATYGSATNLNYGSGMKYVEAGYNSKSGGQHYFQGSIPVMKFYKGKALSASEVKRNFHAYKVRYNL